MKKTLSLLLNNLFSKLYKPKATPKKIKLAKGDMLSSKEHRVDNLVLVLSGALALHSPTSIATQTAQLYRAGDHFDQKKNPEQLIALEDTAVLSFKHNTAHHFLSNLALLRKYLREE